MVAAVVPGTSESGFMGQPRQSGALEVKCEKKEGLMQQLSIAIDVD